MGRGPDGKKKQRWITFHGSKRECEKAFTRVQHELDTGADVAPEHISVAQFLERWLKHYAQPRVSAKTLERYTQIVVQLKGVLGAHQLSMLRPLHIQAAYSNWLTEGRRDKRKGGLAPRTIVHHHRVLLEALRMAVKWQMLGRNPAEAVDPPRVPRTEIRALNNKEILELLSRASGDRLYLPILLGVSTGLRRGEILALKWADINWLTGMLSVRRSVEHTAKSNVLRETKTARSQRAVALPEITLDQLRRHKVQQEKHRELLGSAYHEHDLICPGFNGELWHPDAFSSAFRTLVDRKIRFHDLRHTAATMLLRRGEHPKVVAERLGHSTTLLTLDTYSHVMPGMQDDAVRKIDEELCVAFKQQRLATD